MAWNSCFTDPAGTDPADAVGTDGEFVYVGNVNTRNWTNTEEKIKLANVFYLFFLKIISGGYNIFYINALLLDKFRLL